MYNCDLLDQIHQKYDWYNWGLKGDVDAESLVENTIE